MGRNNTRAAKNIAKMYEQLGLSQDDIFHKTKLLLSIYRDVVWATLSDCRCANAEINYRRNREQRSLLCGLQTQSKSERTSDSVVSGWIHAFRSCRPDISHLCCGCFAQTLPHSPSCFQGSNTARSVDRPAIVKNQRRKQAKDSKYRKSTADARPENTIPNGRKKRPII